MCVQTAPDVSPISWATPRRTLFHMPSTPASDDSAAGSPTAGEIANVLRRIAEMIHTLAELIASTQWSLLGAINTASVCVCVCVCVCVNDDFVDMKK